MNHRLQALKDQAQFTDDRYSSMDEFAEKFAELLIRECAEWIRNTDSDPVIGEEDAQALLEHFGL
jgi:hypothetical protein